MRIPLTAAVFIGALTGALPAQPIAASAVAQDTASEAATLSAAERRAAVDELAALLRNRYVDPAAGQRYAEAIERIAATAGYDGFTEAKAFATRLTDDLRTVMPDKHLRLTVGDIPARGRGSRAQRTLADVEARWAAPGVAYLAINASPGDPAVAAEAERLLLAHAGAKALVIDLRQNSGGTATIMDALLPYLFGEATALVQMDTRAAIEAEFGPPEDAPARRQVQAPDGVVRREHVVSPHATDARFFTVPIYVLTSKRTASVAEHMTLALKRTRRAVIVGETTSGAGNYGSFARVGGRFVAFVPFGRTFDPDTGRGWEGTGIAPDVPVVADQALEAVLGLVSERDTNLRTDLSAKPLESRKTGPRQSGAA